MQKNLEFVNFFSGLLFLNHVYDETKNVKSKSNKLNSEFKGNACQKTIPKDLAIHWCSKLQIMIIGKNIAIGT